MVADDPLPAVPDQTGEPRPPAAPRVNGPWPLDPSDRRAAVGHHPAGQLTRIGGEPFAALETVLVRRPDRWRSSIARVLVICGIPALLVLAVAVVAPTGPLETVLPVLAAVLVLAGSVVYLRAVFGPESYVRLAAGPRHVADTSGAAEDGGSLVDLYRLAAIEVRGPVLRLSGAGTTHALVLPLGALEANQQLWDLVHNGLRHSAAAGARVDPRSRDLLGLPPARR